MANSIIETFYKKIEETKGLREKEKDRIKEAKSTVGEFIDDIEETTKEVGRSGGDYRLLSENSNQTAEKDKRS